MTTLIIYFVLYGASGTYTKTFYNSLECDTAMISMGSYIKQQGGTIQKAGCYQQP